MRRWAVLLAAALTLAGCAPRAATEQGRTIGDLWVLFLVAAAAVGAIVYGLILWSVVRYRRRSQELPPQFRQHLPLEALYTLIPAGFEPSDLWVTSRDFLGLLWHIRWWRAVSGGVRSAEVPSLRQNLGKTLAAIDTQ